MIDWKPTVSTHVELGSIKDATGYIIVFDIFRACSTMAAILESGAERIVLAAESDDARALRRATPDWLFFGEEHGVMLDDADGDNSPANAAERDLSGKTVILRTTTGVPTIQQAMEYGTNVIAGSFVTAEAIFNYLSEIQPEHVSLIAAANNIMEPAREDELAVEYFEAALTGASLDMDTFVEELLQHETSGTHRLLGLGLDADLQYCTQFNTVDITPIATIEDGHVVIRPAASA